MTSAISPMFDLTGRTALVTGGAKGLGLAMAKGLAQHGAPIVLADIDDATGQQAAKDLAAETGVEVSYRHLDVTDQAMVEKVVAEIDQEVGGIEILLNNAGRTIHHPVEDGDGEKWRAVMSLNLDGVYHVLSAVGRAMLERGRGEHHQHRLHERHHRQHAPDPGLLQRLQGRGPQPHPLRRARVGLPRRARERDRARLHAHRADPRLLRGGRRADRHLERDDPDVPPGRAGGARRRRRVPRFRRRELRDRLDPVDRRRLHRRLSPGGRRITPSAAGPVGRGAVGARSSPPAPRPPLRPPCPPGAGPTPAAHAPIRTDPADPERPDDLPVR
uniref:SDR family NAD(P)-dependent oxidoreductase n=1 Tax=Brachybacterium sp. GPGPB12 TaxID=3023517 RepID=UPI004049C4C1